MKLRRMLAWMLVMVFACVGCVCHAEDEPQATVITVDFDTRAGVPLVKNRASIS